MPGHRDRVGGCLQPHIVQVLAGSVTVGSKCCRKFLKPSQSQLHDFVPRDLEVVVGLVWTLPSRQGIIQHDSAAWCLFGENSQNITDQTPKPKLHLWASPCRWTYSKAFHLWPHSVRAKRVQVGGSGWFTLAKLVGLVYAGFGSLCWFAGLRWLRRLTLVCLVLTRLTLLRWVRLLFGWLRWFALVVQRLRWFNARLRRLCFLRHFKHLHLSLSFSNQVYMYIYIYDGDTMWYLLEYLIWKILKDCNKGWRQDAFNSAVSPSAKLEVVLGRLHAQDSLQLHTNRQIQGDSRNIPWHIVAHSAHLWHICIYIIYLYVCIWCRNWSQALQPGQNLFSMSLW